MFQQVIIMGKLAKDIEIKNTPSGKTVGSFSIPCNEKWQGGEHTEWFNCKVWGDRANKIAQYMTKGRLVTVTGTLKSRDHDGKRYTDLVVEKVVFGPDSKKPQGESEPTKTAEPSLDDIPF